MKEGHFFFLRQRRGIVIRKIKATWQIKTIQVPYHYKSDYNITCFLQMKFLKFHQEYQKEGASSSFISEPFENGTQRFAYISHLVNTRRTEKKVGRQAFSSLKKIVLMHFKEYGSKCMVTRCKNNYKTVWFCQLSLKICMWDENESLFWLLSQSSILFVCVKAVFIEISRTRHSTFTKEQMPWEVTSCYVSLD